MKNESLPLDLQYLFQNKYLDCAKILIILYQLKSRKKGINLEELNYYYTMIELLDCSQTQHFKFNNEYYQDNYLINEEFLRNYGILLKSQDFLNILIEKTPKTTILYYKLTQMGLRLVENFESEYFQTIHKKYDFINLTLKYNISNHRKVLRRNEEQIKTKSINCKGGKISKNI